MRLGVAIVVDLNGHVHVRSHCQLRLRRNRYPPIRNVAYKRISLWVRIVSIHVLSIRIVRLITHGRIGVKPYWRIGVCTYWRINRVEFGHLVYARNLSPRAYASMSALAYKRDFGKFAVAISEDVYGVSA